MTFKEFLRFSYGLIMGTSTPYLKPKKRFLFPVHREEIDPQFGLFLGGSCICGFVQGGDDLLVINVNQRLAAEKLVSWLDEKAVRGAATVVLTSLAPDFSAGLPLYGESKRILLGARGKDALPAHWGKDLTSRVQYVEEEMVIDIGDERVRLIPIAPGANGADLAVFLERRSVLFLGSLFFNRFHPVLAADIDVSRWISTLEKLVNRFDPKMVIPAEGDLAGIEDVLLFISYLRDLSDPTVEFSSCRQNYDWHEIPSTTSLEENFDILRGLSKNHTTLN